MPDEHPDGCNGTLLDLLVDIVGIQTGVHRLEEHLDILLRVEILGTGKEGTVTVTPFLILGQSPMRHFGLQDFLVHLPP